MDWEIRQSGGRIVEPRDADVVCVTVISPHEWQCVPRMLKRVGVIPDKAQRLRQRVVLGGQGATSPAIFDPFVDAACVGEGRRFLQVLVREGLPAAMALPHAWVPGETREVEMDNDFPWDAPPIKAEDGIVRLYASRGCKKKCLFCHTGWSVPYREGDEADLVREYKALRKAGYRVNVVTNDAPALSFFDALDGVEHFSASYSQTKRMLESGGMDMLKGVRSVRFGVESPSTRLRSAVGKPIDTWALYDATVALLNEGIGVRWFMIAGLPGETAEDYEELIEVVRRVRHDARKGALQLSFTAFCPDSAAPLCLAPLDDSYWERFDRFWKWFFEGDGYTRRVQLFRCAGPASRLEHAIGSMGATEAELRRGWLDRDPPNWRIRYAYRDRARKAFDVYRRKVRL